MFLFSTFIDNVAQLIIYVESLEMMTVELLLVKLTLKDTKEELDQW